MTDEILAGLSDPDGLALKDTVEIVAKVEQRTDSNGSLLLLVRDAVKQELPGQLNKQMPSQFGIKPMNRRR